MELSRRPIRARRRRRSWGPSIAVTLAASIGIALLVVGLLDSRTSASSLQILRGAQAAPAAGKPTLSAAIQQAIAASGGRAAVSVVELGGSQPLRFTFNGDEQFEAGSTYKLPLLMAEAERIASGRARPLDQLCYQDSDAEDGWFTDYTDGMCLSVQEVATRIGTYSDNTAAHMLADSVGGNTALNAYARSRGARESAFYEHNTTTANDLAALWGAEATGAAGGVGAQAWLEPILSHSKYEDGIAAGLPAGAAVVHKVGFIDRTVNDAGVVTAGGRRYVVAITTDGLGGDSGWALVARISSLVWAMENGTLAV